MDITSWIVEMALGTVLMAGLHVPPAGDLYEVDVRQLAALWEKEHNSPADPYSLRHAELKARLQKLASAYPKWIRMEAAGRSVEGREIFLLTIGRGSERILLWSQMHGDEPTATCALLDLLAYLGSRDSEPWVEQMFQKYSLLIMPMLNPDGAERMQRRNAQGLDINRDARLLQSPEGRLLKEIRDRYQPFIGFNLHNQGSTTTVGDTGKVATIALLAVAADNPGSLRTGALAKQVTAVLYEALSPFIYGHISRYDEEYNPRAFGDNLTLWGTPVVLIETGGSPAGESPNFGVKLNFVGLLAVLNSLTTGRVQNGNPAVFDALKYNSPDPIYDLMLHNALIFTGTGVPLFRGDVAVRGDARGGARGTAIIAEIGDLGVFSAHRTIDCSDAMVTPGLIAWDPGRSPFEIASGDRAYLERGIVTVLETVRWQDLTKNHPPAGEWNARTRPLNWGYLVSGGPARSSDQDQLLLAQWLSAGARAWVREGAAGAARTDGMSLIPRWFGIPTLTGEEAATYQAPPVWEGDAVKVLPHYTSEAAARLAVPRRGIVAQGSVADLVIWSVPAGVSSPDLRDCRPRQVIVNGQLVDPAQPESTPMGRFIGR
jgi:hypothetical protein